MFGEAAVEIGRVCGMKSVLIKSAQTEGSYGRRREDRQGSRWGDVKTVAEGGKQNKTKNNGKEVDYERISPQRLAKLQLVELHLQSKTCFYVGE